MVTIEMSILNLYQASSSSLCLCTAIYTKDGDMITMNNHMQVMCFQWLYFIHCPTYTNPTAKPSFFDRTYVPKTLLEVT